MKTELLLIFDNPRDGKKFTIRVDEPVEDLDKLQIVSAMDEIIASTIFGDLVPVGAKIIETTTSVVDYE